MPFKVESREFSGADYHSGLPIQKYLNDNEKGGWDLISVVPYHGHAFATFVFKKRPCPYCNDLKKVAAMDPSMQTVMIPCRECNMDALIEYINERDHKEIKDG